MRYLALGDIHGCYTALRSLAEFAAFAPHDILIALGDYVDKGPNSSAVLDWLIAYQARAPLVPLRGNHEIMLLEARDSRKKFRDWIEEGGDRTLASYAPLGEAEADRARLADIPYEHWAFVEATVRYYETPTHFFVHANAHADLPLADQPDDMLFWEKFNHPPPHASGKIMVCGHTSQKSFEPVNLGHAVCLDTRCFGGGWLTCLDIATGQLWQANEQGQTRQRHLDDYLQ